MLKNITNKIKVKLIFGKFLSSDSAEYPDVLNGIPPVVLFTNRARYSKYFRKLKEIEPIIEVIIGNKTKSKFLHLPLSKRYLNNKLIAKEKIAIVIYTNRTENTLINGIQ